MQTQNAAVAAIQFALETDDLAHLWREKPRGLVRG